MKMNGAIMKQTLGPEWNNLHQKPLENEIIYHEKKRKKETLT